MSWGLRSVRAQRANRFQAGFQGSILLPGFRMECSRGNRPVYFREVFRCCTVVSGGLTKGIEKQKREPSPGVEISQIEPPSSSA